MAGCALASKLSRALKNHQTYGEGNWALATAPGYNWGYKTIPQVQLATEIDNSRGKGLAGSSAINFFVYTRGPRADYDHWAEQIENFQIPPAEQRRWVDPSQSVHGGHGAVDVGLTAWEREFVTFLDGVHQYNPKVLDLKSGDSPGASVDQVSARDGLRTTASSAYLSELPSNLTILTDVTIEIIPFDQDSAMGVTTKKGEINKTDPITES